MSDARRLAARLVPGYVQAEGLASPEAGLPKAVLRYRVMAYTVGVGLLVLTFAGLPLQYAAGVPQVDEIVGTIHGILYIVYLLTAVDLARRARFTLLQMAAMIGAGFLPFLAFVIEHRVMKRLALLAEARTPGAAASGSPAPGAAGAPS